VARAKRKSTESALIGMMVRTVLVDPATTNACEYTRSTTSNEGRGEEGRGELAGCLGVRLTTGLRCWPGRQMNPTKGGASRQSCTCTDSSVTHGSTGRRIPEGKAATQIEPQDRHGIDWITQISQINRASILRDFAGLESPERICGPLPDQTRIRPYFWPESDSGVPSDSPPKLTGKRKLLESLPKPLIFNIFSAKKWMQVLF
jgi:hypothetical protein